MTSKEYELWAEDDDTHPIARVSVADVLVAVEGGGVHMGLVIAGPLQGDERSQKRLLTKIENYLGSLNSPEFIQEFGKPSVENSSIIVAIDTRSDDVIFALLERCKDWVAENNAKLTIEGNI